MLQLLLRLTVAATDGGDSVVVVVVIFYFLVTWVHSPFVLFGCFPGSRVVLVVDLVFFSLKVLLLLMLLLLDVVF